MKDTYMVFDVESCGLHGEGYAVGVVLVVDGETRDEFLGWCPPERVRGGKDERALAWAHEHVTPTLTGKGIAFRRPVALRDEFWEMWQIVRERGGKLAADVAWPVEARFLAACIDDKPAAREWDGPYPLIDIASVRLACGLDPLAEVERLPNELPAHHPLADARQSARLLMEALRR